MANWELIGDLMFFKTLDSSSVSALTLAYKFKDLGTETWSERFWEFKFGTGAAHVAAVRKSSEVLASALGSIVFPAAGPVVVVGAISSNETVLQPSSPVYSLASHVAAKRGYNFLPKLLRKRSHTSLKTLNGASARDAEVAGVYEATQALPPGTATVLIVDDFITRGATTGDIARALRVLSPKQKYIYAVGLAKTEGANYLASIGKPIDNGHVPVHLETLWGVS
jgi:hypothetical protein